MKPQPHTHAVHPAGDGDKCGFRRAPVRQGSRQHVVAGAVNETTLMFSALPPPAPPFLGVWLLILVDNIMHLTINFFTLEYL